jgi:hypothetical protein
MHYGTITFQNFKIILINNGGGGIFRILPGHKETVLIPSLKLPLFNSGTFSKKCMDLIIPLLVMNKACQKD